MFPVAIGQAFARIYFEIDTKDDRDRFIDCGVCFETSTHFYFNQSVFVASVLFSLQTKRSKNRQQINRVRMKYHKQK